MNLLVILPLVLVVGVLRVMKTKAFASTLVWWIALFVFFAYGFKTPIPGAARAMYMGIATISLATFVFSAPARIEEFFGPLRRMMVEKRYTVLLLSVMLAIPAMVAFNVYREMNVPVEPPFFARTIHPSPPSVITVHDNEVDLIKANNPYRELQDHDPEGYAQRVANGRKTYYQNCFYCHGDGLGGDGMFAYGLNPIPTNFLDAGVLPNFTESFFFWRVSKGGAQLPEAGGPWDSAMPEWERFLTEEEMWETVLFLYDFTGFPPRTVVEEH